MRCILVYQLHPFTKTHFLSQVTGVITDKNGTPQWYIRGTWDDKIEGAKILNTTINSKGKAEYETGPYTVMWQRIYPPYVHTNVLYQCQN